MPETEQKTVGIHTLGCRLNQFESDGIIARFLDEEKKYRLANLESGPDIAIINTCTVTDQAESRSRALVRKILRKNPESKIVITGCYAQTDPERVASIPGVYAVVGNDRKTGLKSIVEDLESGDLSSEADRVFSAGGLDRKKGESKRPVLEDPFAYGDVFPVGHSRAYLKIQDGCDRRCSYCKIPRARGGGVSRSFEEILDHVRRLNDRGIPEIVLTGVNPGWYRDQDRSFNELIYSILRQLDYSRLRLSSIEPCDVDEQLAELSLHPRFCNYFHVPLQSGSRDILRLMRRTYSAESYRKRMETVRRVNPDVFLGTDVITGFPGEKESHFQETLSLLRDLDVVQVHGFPYSPREGTDALNLPDPVDRGLAKERVRILQNYSNSQWKKLVSGLQGKSRVGVIERLDSEKSTAQALSDDYIRIEFPVSSDASIQDIQKLSGRLALFHLNDAASDRSVSGNLKELLPLTSQ